MKFLIILFLLFFSLLITVYFGENYTFEKDLDGKYPYIKELSYYPPGNLEKSCSLVGGWPIYWLIDEPWHSVQGEVSIQDYIILPKFLFNLLFFFIILVGLFISLRKLSNLVKKE